MESLPRMQKKLPISTFEPRIDLKIAQRISEQQKSGRQ
jgi:hypothetical protein